MIQAPAGIIRWVILVVSVWVGLTSLRSYAAPKKKVHAHVTVAKPGAGDPTDGEAGAKKKKVVYRSHTQMDFSGETVQGKIRAPEVFYIFQRKRSQAHHVVAAPDNFAYHSDELQRTIARSLPK
jgi:hypothetical protein